MSRGTAPFYLNTKVEMYKQTRDKPYRYGIGRDKFCFDCKVDHHKSQTWLSKLIVEWNCLPYELRKITDFENFCTSLKTYYFKQAFSDFS